jgi:hypothetical protein
MLRVSGVQKSVLDKWVGVVLRSTLWVGVVLRSTFWVGVVLRSTFWVGVVLRSMLWVGVVLRSTIVECLYIRVLRATSRLGCFASPVLRVCRFCPVQGLPLDHSLDDRPCASNFLNTFSPFQGFHFFH